MGRPLTAACESRGSAVADDDDDEDPVAQKNHLSAPPLSHTTATACRTRLLLPLIFTEREYIYALVSE